ncbi:hypothetical protein DFH07DRAFT_772323 [Mycena maculata]|uniref:Uncharacterized protein n=1 Tax=Mycena maculata TaxID=230809 RepID=A0AAD7NGI5_9AGAR|nr:hypothetical protein DFH07DRAFT_772323 [Mycena maculata]
MTTSVGYSQQGVPGECVLINPRSANSQEAFLDNGDHPIAIEFHLGYSNHSIKTAAEGSQGRLTADLPSGRKDSIYHSRAYPGRGARRIQGRDALAYTPSRSGAPARLSSRRSIKLYVNACERAGRGTLPGAYLALQCVRGTSVPALARGIDWDLAGGASYKSVACAESQMEYRNELRGNKAEGVRGSRVWAQSLRWRDSAVGGFMDKISTDESCKSVARAARKTMDIPNFPGPGY